MKNATRKDFGSRRNGREFLAHERPRKRERLLQSKQQVIQDPKKRDGRGFFPTEFFDVVLAVGAGFVTGVGFVFLTLAFCLGIRAWS